LIEEVSNTVDEIELINCQKNNHFMSFTGTDTYSPRKPTQEVDSQVDSIDMLSQIRCETPFESKPKLDQIRKHLIKKGDNGMSRANIHTSNTNSGDEINQFMASLSSAFETKKHDPKTCQDLYM
jgi:hypothetical protein